MWASIMSTADIAKAALGLPPGPHEELLTRLLNEILRSPAAGMGPQLEFRWTEHGRRWRQSWRRNDDAAKAAVRAAGDTRGGARIAIAFRRGASSRPCRRHRMEDQVSVVRV